jgi:hypothetical protein
VRSKQLTSSIAGIALAPLIAACATATPRVDTTLGYRCTDEAHHAFDFWLGKWDISQRILRSDGSWMELPARNRVSAAPDHCVITEYWTGQVQFFWEGMTAPEPIWGFSVRALDPETGDWTIYWMDRRTPHFSIPYVGRFANGRGDFFRTVRNGNGASDQRITFSQNSEGEVLWDLAVSSDQKRTWTTLWTMTMRPLS